MNLLLETIKILKENDKTPADVVWCGSRDYGWFSWGHFESLAKDTEYDNGYGGQEVAPDLLIVGKDFWLERHDYDGSEWWEFKSLPVRPAEKVEPTRLGGELCRDTLKESQEIDKNPWK